ncbi:hypothetical protein [Streptomyces rubiginosohelvolus]|uniref:hypothetical protein n=1 Tax=Streptomyces rubiginosohelvolus TaxID=67362 RepID=UPI0036907C43
MSILKRRVAALAVGATVVLVGVPLSSGTAAADIVSISCKTPDGGAIGKILPIFQSKTSMVVGLGGTDSRADGAYPRIRLDITTAAGNRYTYPWREVKGGNGTVKTWDSTATHKDGIVSARVEVQNFKGSSPVSTCYSARTYNQYW